MIFVLLPVKQDDDYLPEEGLDAINLESACAHARLMMQRNYRIKHIDVQNRFGRLQKRVKREQEQLF